MTAQPVRTTRLGASLLARQKGRWTLNVAIWVVIYLLPVIPGLITRAFFDRVSGATTGGLGVPVLVGLIAAYGVGRIAVDNMDELRLLERILASREGARSEPVSLWLRVSPGIVPGAPGKKPVHIQW